MIMETILTLMISMIWLDLGGRYLMLSSCVIYAMLLRDSVDAAANGQKAAVPLIILSTLFGILSFAFFVFWSNSAMIKVGATFLALVAFFGLRDWIMARLIKIAVRKHPKGDRDVRHGANIERDRENGDNSKQ